MKTDGLFDFRIVEIDGKYNKPINLIFDGDTHFNSPQFARTEWENDCEKLKRISKQAPTWFIKMGDIFEALSTSERRSFSNGEFHESNRTRWEKEYAKEIDDYVKQSSFQIDHTLAVFGGNHFFQFWDGTTSDMALASKLHAPYIGVCGYIVLVINIGGYHKHVVKIFVHHGKSSGKRAGSAFLALEDAASYFADADIICMGLDLKAGAMRINSLNIDRGSGKDWKVKSKDRIIGRTGSYLKSYEAGVKSYSVDAMYRPSALGFLQVIVTPRRKNFGDATKQYKNNRSDDRWIELQAMI